MRANATTPAVGRRRAAFSLIEVIAAVVIFAVGMISVLGLYGPLTKSVAAVSDTDAAARVADAVREVFGPQTLVHIAEPSLEGASIL